MNFKQIINISFGQEQENLSRNEDNPYTNDLVNTYEFCSETVEFNLDIFGEPVLFHIDVFPKLMTLSEVVPLAREIASEISDIIQIKTNRNETSIPCHKGCSTCCNYLVPLSIPEAFRLKQEIIELPGDTSKNVLDSFHNSAKSILNNETPNINQMNLEEISKWYSELNITCPFLSENACSIYDNRPIACREYLVKGSNFFCSPTQIEDSNKINLPLSILECLGKLSAELKNTDIEAVMMPLALLWTEEYPDSDEVKWHSVELIQKFAGIIKESIENPSLLASC